MTENEFLRQQQAAVERMREMNRRAAAYNSQGHKMPPAPAFVRVQDIGNNRGTEAQRTKNAPPENEKPYLSEPKQSPLPKPKAQSNTPHSNEQKGASKGLSLPFLDLLSDRDTALIIGILLILISENSDKMLLFALIYILM